MEQIPFTGFTGKDSTVFSKKADCQRLMCLYRETIQSGDSENQYALYKTPGLLNQVTPAVGRHRGTYELNDHVFDVIGGTVYELTDADIVSATSYAGLADDGLPVIMAANTETLLIVSAGVLYAINGGALSVAGAPAAPISVAFVDGYFVILSAMNQFFFSVDGLTWDPLDFQTAEAAANNIIAMIVDHDELWLIGNRVAQVFTVGSDPDTPFVQRKDGIIQQGTGAAASIVALDNSLFWLGRNKAGTRTVVRMDGYQPKKVSTYAVENTLRKMRVVSDCIGMGFQLNGHSMVWFTFPTEDRTICYDATEDDWYEVGYWNVSRGIYERHRANCIVSAFDKILVGDHTNGKLYELSPEHLSDDGNPIRWLRRCPHLTKLGKNIQYGRLEIIAETGVGLDG